MIVTITNRSLRPLVAAIAVALVLLLPSLPASAGTAKGELCSTVRPATTSLSSTQRTAVTAALPSGGTPWLVKDIWPGRDGSFNAPGQNLMAVGTKLFFAANDGVHGTELWVTDGSAAGTRLVKNIAAGGASSQIAQVHVLGNILVFTAKDGIHGRELWASDGTTAGTRMLRDILHGTSGAIKSWSDMTVVGHTLYFTANDGIHGRELWKSDGAASGTRLVKDITAGPIGTKPSALAAFNGKLFFAAKGGLWKSDGTTAGTSQVVPNKALPTGEPEALAPTQLFAVGKTLYFSVTSGSWDGCANSEWTHLWKTDGTKAGTHRLAQVEGSLFTRLNGKLYFSGPGESGHARLWTSDGTVAGTRAIMPKIALDENLASVGGRLYWNYRDNSLWTSNGTYSGTELLKISGSDQWGASTIDDSVVIDGLVYFAAGYGYETDDGNWDDNFQLWQTDGTPSGTVQTAVINSAGSSQAQQFTAVGGQMYFVCIESTFGRELWSYAP